MGYTRLPRGGHSGHGTLLEAVDFIAWLLACLLLVVIIIVAATEFEATWLMKVKQALQWPGRSGEQQHRIQQRCKREGSGSFHDTLGMMEVRVMRLSLRRA